MKFTIPQSLFAQHLALVSRAVPNRPSHPILANIKMVVDENGLSLTAFDLTLGITAQCPLPLQAVESGAVCVPAKMLADIVNRLPDTVVHISLAGNQLTLKAGKGKFSLQCKETDEYPELPEVDAEAVTVPASVLLAGIAATAPFASDDDSKGVLVAVRVTGSSAGLELAATNGHYLAVWGSDEYLFSDEIGVNLPAVAATELVKLINTEKDRRKKAKDETLLEVDIQLDDSQAIFTVAGHRLVTRLLAGQYPSYKQLMPKQFSKSVEFDRQEFSAALERVRIVAAQKNDVVKLSIADEDVKISAVAADVGDGAEYVDVTLNGEPLDIAFQAGYLTTILKIIQSERVRVELNGSTNPAIVSPIGESAAKWQCLLMPVQIPGV